MKCLHLSVLEIKKMIRKKEEMMTEYKRAEHQCKQFINFTVFMSKSKD